jgi:hypothetical protein
MTPLSPVDNNLDFLSGFVVNKKAHAESLRQGLFCSTWNIVVGLSVSITATRLLANKKPALKAGLRVRLKTYARNGVAQPFKKSVYESLP